MAIEQVVAANFAAAGVVVVVVVVYLIETKVVVLTAVIVVNDLIDHFDDCKYHYLMKNVLVEPVVVAADTQQYYGSNSANLINSGTVQ